MENVMKSAKTRNRIRHSKGDQVFAAIIYTLLGLFVIVELYPMLYTVSASFSDPSAVGSGEMILWPIRPSLDGYEYIFAYSEIWLGYANTLFYTVVGTLINLVVTIPAAYALSRRDFKDKGLFMTIFMFTMYFGGGMIPTFLLIKNLGLYNTRAVLLILGAFSCYNCIICRTFFASIPKELEEAASIDGCAPIRCFIQIILPISQALLGVMVLYFAVGHWNSYFNAMMYIYDESKRPLQLVLRSILVEAITNANMMDGSFDDEYAAEMYKIAQQIKFAVIVVSSLPVLILYPFLQKYFVKGVMIGSVKG